MTKELLVWKVRNDNLFERIWNSLWLARKITFEVFLVYCVVSSLSLAFPSVRHINVCTFLHDQPKLPGRQKFIWKESYAQKMAADLLLFQEFLSSGPVSDVAWSLCLDKPQFQSIFSREDNEEIRTWISCMPGEGRDPWTTGTILLYRYCYTYIVDVYFRILLGNRPRCRRTAIILKESGMIELPLLTTSPYVPFCLVKLVLLSCMVLV